MEKISIERVYCKDETSMNYPTISVVIPVRNEAIKIRACIEGILAQSVPVKEIIVVDSGSTDGTIEILREYEKVRIIEIDSSSFNHGETRNVGVSNASGEFCVLTVGDAKPYNNDWINHLLSGFSDENVAGVCGRQVVPHDPDKNPVDWFRPISEPETVSYHFDNAEEFNALSAAEKKSVCSWDDVTAMYRRKVLLEIPFQKTTFAEDALWAKDALLAGYTIVYNPAARVYHYHIENPEFTYKRTFTVFYHFYKFFGLKPQLPGTTVKKKLSTIKTLAKERSIDLSSKWQWWKYNMEVESNMARAVKSFNAAMAEGEDYLDKLHQELCGVPPIPKKN
jgi:rhamnosyltransferase